MKRAFLLLETLLSFCIIGMVFFFSTMLYKHILQNNQVSNELALTRMDLLATQLFIEKQLNNGRIVDVSKHSVRFYALDLEGYLQGFYSGIIDLTKSSKSKVYTPKSQTTHLTSTFILFNDSILYELIPSPHDNVLYFKDSTSVKTIYEHYTVVKNISALTFKDNSLYFNDTLLQNNLTQFNASVIPNHLKIHICLKNLCEDWIF